MRITISNEEFEAICFAEDLLETTIEASDDDFAHDASIHANHLLSIVRKLREASHKDRGREKLYQLAKETYPNERPNVLRKIVRKALAIQKATRSTQI